MTPDPRRLAEECLRYVTGENRSEVVDLARALLSALAELEQVKKERDEAKRSEAGARKAAWGHGQCRREAEAQRDRLAETLREIERECDEHAAGMARAALASMEASMEGDK